VQISVITPTTTSRHAFHDTLYQPASPPVFAGSCRGTEAAGGCPTAALSGLPVGWGHVQVPELPVADVPSHRIGGDRRRASRVWVSGVVGWTVSTAESDGLGRLHSGTDGTSVAGAVVQQRQANPVHSSAAPNGGRETQPGAHHGQGQRGCSFRRRRLVRPTRTAPSARGRQRDFVL
jgi:hypothetical protein